MSQITKEDLDAFNNSLSKIANAIDINDSDTLSMITPDHKVIWIASGSWSGHEEITLGDLRNIVRVAKNMKLMIG